MSRSVLAYWVACVTAIVVLLYLRRSLDAPAKRTNVPSQTAPAAAAGAATDSHAASAAASQASMAEPGGATARTAPAPAAAAIATATSPALELEFTNFPPATVMENTRAVVHAYAARFNGNPVGTNPEIAAALNGGNPGQVKFLRAEDGLRLNERGELVDPWGTPYFFHQLSAKEMEIRSAGPDRVMWTADDLFTR